jgi:hypothetical protein
VKPQGIYAEVGLYLHLSARDWGYGQDDQLEIELDFTLPEDAIVIDSWLWVEGKIIRGELMDKWTAAEIYEDIVDRRRDPSILYKHYDNQYELRIYPLIADSYRKVKITYLVPMQWHANGLQFHYLTIYWLNPGTKSPKPASFFGRKVPGNDPA